MKKFLSLVLALVMTMSLVTVSAGAKDFTDSTKIQYTEAVDVMSAVKVIDGYADGSFNPSATLTRGAAAKIICNLILGPTTASALVADAAPYSDVPVNHTFAGYIAYCQKEGIISGYADGTFKPANSLTGYAFMKMLLGALGYKAENEGYTGANWSIQVAKRAINVGLNDDLNGSFNGVKAVTREEACLYAFNTLKATMVEYEKNSTVTVGNITIKDTSSAKEMVNNAKTETIKDDNKMQFAEKYFDKLSISTKASDKMDDFGRPATTWIYDKETVGTYADTADQTLVLNKDLSAKKLLITDADYMNYNDKDVASDIVVYVNGTPVVTKKADLTYELKAGDEVEAFENDDGAVETVAVIRYTLAKIANIDTKLSNTYTKKGATTSITLEDLGETGFGVTYYDVYDGDSSKELADFSADTYKEGTVLAVAMKDNTVLASHIASAVEGKITAADTGSKANLTMGGSKYPIHSEFDYKGNDGHKSDLVDMTNTSEYTVYTDKNGYVIGIDESGAAKITDVYYVTGILKDTSRYTKYYAQAVSLVDGKVTEFQLDTGDVNTNKAFKNADDATDSYITGLFGVSGSFKEVEGLFTFDKSGSKYTAKRYITKPASPKVWETYDSTYTVLADTDRTPLDLTSSGKLSKDDTKMTIGSKFYLNDSTNYIKVEKSGDNIKVKFITGGTSANLSSVGGIAITKKDAKNDVASYVILVGDSISNSTSDDVVFVHEQSSAKVTYNDADGKLQTGYETELYFLDGSGKIETVTVEGSAKAAGFYTWEINDDKVYELTACNGTTLDKALPTLSADYKDETGSAGFEMGTAADESLGDILSTAGVKLTGIYNSALSAEDVSSTHDANDVDFADNVIIRDNRGSSARDKDVYTSKIESVGALKTAIDRSKDVGGEVKAVVYFDDEEVIMVYVMAVADADASGAGSTSSWALTGTPTVSIVSGNVTVAQGTAVIKKGATTAAVPGLTLKVVVSGLNRDLEWVEIATESKTVDLDASGKLPASTTLSTALPTGSYRVAVTLSGTAIDGTINLGNYTI